jgi:hypothetical protein
MGFAFTFTGLNFGGRPSYDPSALPAHLRNRQLLRLPRKRNLETRAATKQPDGQITQSRSSPFGKNILIFRNGKSVHIPNVSPDERGGSRVVTNARWDAVDAKVATDERDWSGR